MSYGVPKRPYSTWRRAGDFVIISGQIGLLADSTLADGGAPGQLRQALANAKAVLAEGGASFSDVVKATLFLLDMKDFGALNEIWLETFSDPLPTRSAIAVAELPFGASAEVELWAYAPEN